MEQQAHLFLEVAALLRMPLAPWEPQDHLAVDPAQLKLSRVASAEEAAKWNHDARILEHCVLALACEACNCGD